jgi:hypothetical protein
MKRFVIFYFFIIFSFPVFSQYPGKIIQGYRELLVDLYVKKSRTVNDSFLNELIDIVSKKDNAKRIGVLVPLLYIDENTDTVVLFTSNYLLWKHRRRNEVKFFNRGMPDDLNGQKVSKNILNSYYQGLKYDSIFFQMENNILVNTEKFTFDHFFSLEENFPYCCNFSNDIDRLSMVYFFFINGILFQESSSYRRLNFQPY